MDRGRQLHDGWLTVGAGLGPPNRPLDLFGVGFDSRQLHGCKSQLRRQLPTDKEEVTVSDNITIIDGDGNDTPVTFDIHLDNPFVTEVEQRAWTEGYTAARHDNVAKEALENPEDFTNRTTNPYTSGDTVVAWARGYEDFSYHPQPFDPGQMTEAQQGLCYVGFSTYMNPQGGRQERLLWSWPNYGKAYEADKPAWADNRPEDRSLAFDVYNMRGQITSAVQYGNRALVPEGAIELPCPPYEFEYEEGGLRITKGSFTKWGDKDSWESVIATMQEWIDDMPSGLNISNLMVELEVQVSATTNINVSAQSLLDSDVFHGDANELEEALADAINDLDLGDYIDSYAEYTNVSAEGCEPVDLSWDIKNGAVEL